MESNLYPKLVENAGPSFRLNHVKEIRAIFEKELEDRRKTINKYKKAHTGVSWVSYGFTAIGIACGASSIVLIATGIGAVIGIALEGVGIGIGLLSVPINFGNKKIWKKLEKHEEIYILAISKLNSINDLVSKALEDGRVDETEYKMILTEYDKYIELKNAIRKALLTNNQKEDVEELKKELLEKGKELGKKEIMEKLLK